MHSANGILSGIHVACYIALFLYFKSQGGYKAHRLEATDNRTGGAFRLSFLHRRDRVVALDSHLRGNDGAA